MQLRHDGRRLGHSVDGLGQQVFGVRGSKEDTLYTRIAHGTQQVGKARLAKQIATIGVDVLAQQCNLTHALAYQAGHLVDNLLERAALFATAHIRHDAIGTEVIAARHNGDPSVILGLTMPRHAHSIRVLVLIGANMTLAVQECLGNELGHMRDGMRAKDDIDVIDIGEQILTVALRDAAAHGDHALARRRRREALTRVALTVQTGVSGLTNAARHEHDNVSMLRIERHEAAIRVEQATHALGVVLIHLAAKGADKVGFTGKNIAYGTLVHVYKS